jgi:alpha-beta hydrolase superfamily lysophospholipase
MTEEREVDIPLGGEPHGGSLGIPPGAQGLVLFAHGSGSSRFSPRNAFVAEALRRNGMATLLFDLLTEREDRNYSTRFDIDLLTRRLVEASAWVAKESDIRDLPLGLFGASTGAAAALKAAATDERVRAVVSRGGRPDLAGDALSQVRAATLLIVGGEDDIVIELNRDAYARLQCEKELQIVPGATHLFEEPGTLEEVARLAAHWFRRHLTPASTAP